jgi:hypothetical protein
MIERYIPGRAVVQAPSKRKAPRHASTYRGYRRNLLKNTKRVRMSRAERLKQGPAKYIERKE